MKKKLLSILLCLVMVVGLLPTAVLAAGEVAIDEANFPDANFRSYVKNEFDTDKNDKLSSAEIATVKKIEANNKGIKSLKGVGFFTALETLNCWDNELTGLDLSKNTALKELQCSNSKLQSLDLSQNTNLTYLYCGRNPLTTLDLSKNAKLKVLNCSGFGNKHMELTELDLSQNTALESLDCSLNKLKELNVSGCTALVKLDCGGNQLDALDVSKNKNLIELLFSSNQLEALDVSKNTKLEKLYCRDNFLAELDVSKNLELKSISCGKNGLTSLDLDKNEKITDVNSDNQQFYNKGTLPAGGTFDMKTLPGSFDPKRAIVWQGGTMDETTGILTVDADAEAVTYKYKTKSDSTETKYLMPCKMQVRGGTTPPTTYTVSFDANGGTGTMADVIDVTGSYALPANAFTAPAGQQFKGWATSASGAVITGTSITVSADTKLYAIWEPIPATEYTISFNINGGIGTIPSQTTSGQKLSSLPTATHSGSYSFAGWYTAASGGTQITTAYEFSADTTVYAHWTYTGGGSFSSYVPTVQKPEITIIGSGKADLSADGRTATITANAGHELVSVVLNGKEMGKVEKLTGLKTGDKATITFQAKTDGKAEMDKMIAQKASKLTLMARSKKTAKKNIKVVVKADLKAITDAGYTVKYKFYRSTKKTAGYKAVLTKKAPTYVNTYGKKGTMYYYKARVMIYDKEGNFVAQTALKQCKYASRLWTK